MLRGLVPCDAIQGAVFLGGLRVADAVPDAALPNLLCPEPEGFDLLGNPAAGPTRPEVVEEPLDGDPAAVASEV